MVPSPSAALYERRVRGVFDPRATPRARRLGRRGSGLSTGIFVCLALGGACDASVPPPRFVDAGSCDGPAGRPPVFVDQDCADRVCALKTAVEGCTLSVQLRTCLGGDPVLRMTPEGSATLLGFDCVPEPAPKLAPATSFDVRCIAREGRTCVFRAYSSSTSLGARVEEVLVDAAREPAEVALAERNLNGVFAFQGPILDAERLGDALYVATTSTGFTRACTSIETELEIRALDTGALRSKRRSLDCLARLRADGDANLVAIGWSGRRFRFARLDREGALTSTPTALPPTWTSDFRPTALERVGPRWVVAAMSLRPPHVSRLAIFDDTLRLVQTSSAIPEAMIVSVFGGLRGEVLALDSALRDLLVFEDGVRGLPVRVSLLVPQRLSDEVDPGPALALPDRGLVYLAGVGEFAGLASMPLDTARLATAVPDTAQVLRDSIGIWAIAPDPRSPNYLLAGITERQTDRDRLDGVPPPARLARVALDPMRVLPIDLPVGVGVVSRILPADATSVWVVLGWTGQLVRVELGP